MGQSSASPSHDAALGAVLGALAGDAAGAVLEFLDRAPTRAEVERALTYPGGGVLRVAPGQVTDDGELTICLLHALAGEREFSLDRVAGWYGRWLRSSPFDIGNATNAGLAPARGLSNDAVEGLAARMQAAALQSSPDSKANGSLMRATPLGVWGHRLADDALADAARQDSSLTHPHRSCGDAVAAYSIAIAHLVRTPGDRVGAWERAHAWAARAANDEVRGWLDRAMRDERPDFEDRPGYVKHGFTEAFRQLRRGADWETAVRETLLGGGDTDTNACIVGGLVGAAVGVEGVPLDARQAVLESVTERGRGRPGFVHPREVPELVRRTVSEGS